MKDDDDFPWQDYRASMVERSKERRASNRSNSAQLLRRQGVEFDERNDGAHLIVQSVRGVMDFWPGTGKWICRTPGGGPSKGRGVFPLLRFIGV